MKRNNKNLYNGGSVMPWYSTVLLTALTVLVSLIVTLVFNKVVSGGKKALEKRREERREDTEEVVVEVVKPLVKKLETIDKDLQATKSGLQSELRHDIRNSCRRCIQQGYRTAEDIDEVASMYEDYEALGTNGKTNALYNAFNQLPIYATDTALEPKKPGRKKALLEEKR